MAYTATATTKGGRDGRSVLDDGKLALAMALPKDMGGSGEGHNPEQLLALLAARPSFPARPAPK